MAFVLTHLNYFVAFLLMVIGLWAIISSSNLIKKLIGLSIFQVSVLLMYISIGKVEGGAIPLLTEKAVLYSNPVPHVLMLTAIVVGVSTLAVGLALVVSIKKTYGTIEEKEILEINEAEEIRSENFARKHE